MSRTVTTVMIDKYKSKEVKNKLWNTDGIISVTGKDIIIRQNSTTMKYEELTIVYNNKEVSVDEIEYIIRMSLRKL